MAQESGGDWIQGDGGPAVVLQKTAAARWRGAADFDNSLMNGGSVETDYDVICSCEDGVSVIERYDRSMLVLSDSEFATRFMRSTAEEVVVIQWFGSDSEPEELVHRLTASRPSVSLPFTIQDAGLRLLVGADGGKGESYGFVDVEMLPGEKVCDVYFSDEAQVVVIRPTNPSVA